MATNGISHPRHDRVDPWSSTTDQPRWRSRESRLQRPHWSYSQLSQYLRCPRQYYFERVLKLKRPFVSCNLVLGSVVHELLAEYHSRLQLGRELTAEEARTLFQRSWQQREVETPIQYGTQAKDDLIEQGIGLIDLYLDEPTPKHIIGVEQCFVVPLLTSANEYLEMPLVAIVDLLTDGLEGLVVTEFKTSTRRYSDNGTDRLLQSTCYRHAVEQYFDRKAEVEYQVLVRTQSPLIQSIDTDRDSLDPGRLGDLVQTVERAIGAKAYYPIQSVMNCSGCPFFRPCQDWGRSSSLRASQ